MTGSADKIQHFGEVTTRKPTATNFGGRFYAPQYARFGLPA